MTFYILTVFPKIFDSVLKTSILKRAQDKKLANFKILNLREFSQDKRKTIDDRPYGGGKGMILKVDTIVKALESIQPKPYSILLSASGKKYTQKTAFELTKKKSLVIVCGHYEGVDARVENFVDSTISIGDFVLTGGEIAALVIIDSVTRLLPGVIKKESTDIESFSPSTINHQPSTLLEYPQYTRPENFRGHKVPKVLLSGNHKQIDNWRREQSVKRTRKFRPDLIKN